jgi:hypothetical protein
MNCKAPADCEIEPSLSMNASAMAVIDAAAKAMTECWKKSGLIAIETVASPPGMNLVLRRYGKTGQADATVCTMAELKPFGADKLTTSFRAACK